MLLNYIFLSGETSRLLTHENNVVYNVNFDTDQISTADLETAEHFEKLYCPGNILQLIERYMHALSCYPCQSLRESS